MIVITKLISLNFESVTQLIQELTSFTHFENLQLRLVFNLSFHILRVTAFINDLFEKINSFI